MSSIVVNSGLQKAQGYFYLYNLFFFTLQHPVLNKRLGIVIFEGVLELLFQEQDFKTIFQKLHSRSTRVRNELKNSKRNIRR